MRLADIYYATGRAFGAQRRLFIALIRYYSPTAEKIYDKQVH